MLTRQSNIILIKNILFMTTLLKLQNVNLKYQNDKKNLKVLNNINLTVKKKETISIVGGERIRKDKFDNAYRWIRKSHFWENIF